MPRLIELVYDGGPVLDAAYAAQRDILEEALGRGFLTIDLRGQGRKARTALLRECSKHSLDAVLVRGTRGLEEALPFFAKIPFFLDHVSPYDFGVRGEFLKFGHRLRRAFVYSPKGDAGVRHSGLGRITMLSGPYMPELREPLPSWGTPTLGLLDLGHGGRRALGQIKRVRDAQNLYFEIVTTLKDSSARQVGSPFEVAEQCHLLCCPMEFKDGGEPHQGAVLALSVGRALATSMTSSMLALPYPPDKYVKIEKYGHSGYGTAWSVYRQSRQRFDDWAQNTKTDHTQLAREILTRL